MSVSISQPYTCPSPSASGASTTSRLVFPHGSDPYVIRRCASWEKDDELAFARDSCFSKGPFDTNNYITVTDQSPVSQVSTTASAADWDPSGRERTTPERDRDVDPAAREVLKATLRRLHRCFGDSSSTTRATTPSDKSFGTMYPSMVPPFDNPEFNPGLVFDPGLWDDGMSRAAMKRPEFVSRRASELRRFHSVRGLVEGISTREEAGGGDWRSTTVPTEADCTASIQDVGDLLLIPYLIPSDAFPFNDDVSATNQGTESTIDHESFRPTAVDHTTYDSAITSASIQNVQDNHPFADLAAPQLASYVDRHQDHEAQHDRCLHSEESRASASITRSALRTAGRMRKAFSSAFNRTAMTLSTWFSRQESQSGTGETYFPGSSRRTGRHLSGVDRRWHHIDDNFVHGVDLVSHGTSWYDYNRMLRTLSVDSYL